MSQDSNKVFLPSTEQPPQEAWEDGAGGRGSGRAEEEVPFLAKAVDGFQALGAKFHVVGGRNQTADRPGQFLQRGMDHVSWKTGKPVDLFASPPE